MNLRTLLVLLLATLSGCSKVACKRGTILLTVEGLVAMAGDVISVDITSVDDTLALHGNGPLRAVQNGGTIELDTSSYPTGKVVTITASVRGATGSTTVTLDSSCSVATVAAAVPARSRSPSTTAQQDP